MSTRSRGNAGAGPGEGPHNGAAGPSRWSWLGTSAGSINAVLWGARAHLGAEVAGEQVVELWKRMSRRDVYRASPVAAWEYAAGAAFGVGPGATSLLVSLRSTGARGPPGDVAPELVSRLFNTAPKGTYPSSLHPRPPGTNCTLSSTVEVVLSVQLAPTRATGVCH